MRILPHLIGIGLSFPFADKREVIGSFHLVYDFHYMDMQHLVLHEPLVSDDVDAYLIIHHC